MKIITKQHAAYEFDELDKETQSRIYESWFKVLVWYEKGPEGVSEYFENDIYAEKIDKEVQKRARKTIYFKNGEAALVKEIHNDVQYKQIVNEHHV